MKSIFKWIAFLLLIPFSSGGMNMENDFLYYPGGERPAPQMLKSENMALWHATASDYRGIVADIERPAPNGTIVLFHGNGGTAADRGFYLQPLTNLGYRVILAEYPRYGGRPGQTGEKPFVADGLKTIQLAHEQYGEPLYLFGESLGCGVAAAIAAKASTPIDGIILITPWDTLQSVAESLFPFLSSKPVLTDRYDSIGNLKSFKGKIAVVGAENDEILPIRHAHALYASLPEGQKRMWVIKGAGHNDWPFYADASLFKEITGFVKTSKK